MSEGSPRKKSPRKRSPRKKSPRKKAKLNEDLFIIDTERKTATCKLCGKILTSMRNFAFERHYASQHRDVAVEIIGLPSCANETVSNPEDLEDKRGKISIRMTRTTYIRSLVELVTVSGIPLNTLNCKALRKLLDPIERGLNAKPSEAVDRVDASSIRLHLAKIAKKIKEIIMREVKGKMICMKIDIATRMDRDMLGINIQYVDKNKIKIRTLAMIELKARHTAENLKQEILSILSAFNIEIISLYTVTTDNGSNMIATVRLLETEQNDSSLLNLTEADLDLDRSARALEDSSTDDPGELSDGSDDDDDDTDDDDEEVDDSDQIGTDENGKRLDMRLDAITSILSGVRCAAHTVQLAVSDALKDTNLKQNLHAIKLFAKKLRKMPYKNVFKINKKPKPKLSCDTRWNSQYDMADSLLREKEFIQSITKNDKDCCLSQAEWEFIGSFVVAFKPVEELTKSLQSSQLTFGDFYLLWIRCKLTLEKLQDELAKTLLEKMLAREAALTSSKAFLAAIFVDPRINYRYSPLITEEQRVIALEHLKNTWLCMERTAKGFHNQNAVDDPREGPSRMTDDILEQFLQAHEGSSDSISGTELFDQLEDLSRLPRLKLEKGRSILDYWISQKPTKPDLYSLATLALSTPATQVSVERSFSALALILTKMRTRLSENTLADILFIKLNSELLKHVSV